MDPSTGEQAVEVSSNKGTAWTAILVCAACCLGATIGSTLRFPRIGTAVLFPPYAILTAALLNSPPRRWWIYLLAASVGDFWPHRAGGDEVSFVLLAEVANHTRAIVAAYGIRRFAGARNRFDTLRGMSILLFFAVLFAPVTGAFVGAGIVKLHASGADYWLAWQAWLLSNTLTGLTVLPIILISAAEAGSRAKKTRLHLLEADLPGHSLLTLGTGLLFKTPSAPPRPRPRLPPQPP